MSEDDDSENFSERARSPAPVDHRARGPVQIIEAIRGPNGNGNGNGSYKIVWVWAGFATIALSGAIGWFTSRELDRNDLNDQRVEGKVDAAITNQARMGVELEIMQREIERLRGP